MAAVSIEFQAFHDPRFKVLATLSGFSHYDAIGRMAAVWVYVTDKNSPILSRVLFEALVEIVGYADWAIEAQLLEAVDDNCVRIKGAVGRIEWLATARERQKIASLAAKAKRERDRKSKSDPTSEPISDPPLVSSSASASAPTPKKRSVDPSDATCLWELYAKGVKANGVEPIHEGPKTYALCSKLVKQHGIEQARDLVLAYLADRTPFVTDKAWGLSLLVSQQQEFLAKAKSARPRAPLKFGDDS